MNVLFYNVDPVCILKWNNICCTWCIRIYILVSRTIQHFELFIRFCGLQINISIVVITITFYLLTKWHIIVQHNKESKAVRESHLSFIKKIFICMWKDNVYNLYNPLVGHGLTLHVGIKVVSIPPAIHSSWSIISLKYNCTYDKYI